MSKVIDFKYRQEKKQIDESLAKNRIPLYVSYKTGKITGNTELDIDFGSRLQKVRNSIEKINNLIKEIKELSNERSNFFEQKTEREK